MSVARLPTVGADTDEWGGLLNEWLDNRSAGVFNVLDYGAKGDAVLSLAFQSAKGGGYDISLVSGTDDTTAIQEAIDEWKSLGSQSEGKRAVLRFPNGVYRFTSLNFTNIRAQGMEIDCEGSILFSEADGAVALDFTLSRWIRTTNLHLYGSVEKPPSVGLFHSRDSTGAPSGEHLHYAPVMLGSFTTACLVNISAESTTLIYPSLNNSHDSNDAAVVMLGARNTFGVTSAFQDQQTDTRSFNGVTMWQPQLRKFRRGYVGHISGGMHGLHMRGSYHYMNGGSDVGATTRDAYWIVEDVSERANEVIYIEGDLEAASPGLEGSAVPDYFISLENGTAVVKDLEVASQWGSKPIDVALIKLAGSVGVTGLRTWLNGDHGVQFWDRTSGTPALTGLDLRDIGGPGVSSLPVILDFSGLGLTEGVVSLRDHAQQVSNLTSLSATSGVLITSGVESYLHGRWHVRREHHINPSGVPTTHTMMVSTSTGHAADRGATLGIGGVVDSAGTERALAVIAGKKTNGTSGNTSGYMTFHTHQNGVGLNEWMRIDDTGLTEIKGGVSLAEVLSQTTDPGVAGRLWNDSGTVKISAGA